MLIFCSCLVSLGVAGYLFGIGTVQSLHKMLNSLNESAKLSITRIKAVDELINFVKLQSAAKQLSETVRTFVEFVCRINIRLHQF